MGNKQWTPEDIAYIARHINSPRAELAAHFNVTYANITARISRARKQLGIPCKNPSPYIRDRDNTVSGVREVLGDEMADKMIKFFVYLCKFNDIAKARGERLNIKKFIDAYAEVWDRD